MRLGANTKSTTIDATTAIRELEQLICTMLLTHHTLDQVRPLVEHLREAKAKKSREDYEAKPWAYPIETIWEGINA